MAKPLLFLAALTLCCCITTLEALAAGRGCRCIRSISTPVPLRVIQKLEMIPVSGHCRWTEIIVTRKNGSKVCVNPEAMWVKTLLDNLRKKDGNSNLTTGAPTASTTDV